MIVHERQLLDDTPRPGHPGAQPSLAILEAALEIGREGRHWLGGRLIDDRAAQANLEGEVQRLEQALQGREAAIAALSEQAAAAANLNSQLSRQISVLWDERERLLGFLDEAAREREQRAASLGEPSGGAPDVASALAALTRERDALAAELVRLRSGAPPAAGEPAVESADLVELGQALELIGGALGEIRQLALDARTGAPAAVTATPAASAATGLTALTGLQGEVGKLGERIEWLAASLGDLLDAQASPPSQGITYLSQHRRQAEHVHPARDAAMVDRDRAARLLPALSHGARTRPLLTLQAVERALARALPSIGLPREIVAPLLSTWLAGAAPMVSGRDALTTLSLCGRVLAGDRVAIVPVSASFNYPEQLFLADDASEADAEARSTLLDLLLDAVSADGRERLSLVIFEGANRASAERVLLPLLRTVSGRAADGSALLLDRVLPDGSMDDERVAALAQRPWPGNVLVAATLTDEDGARPLPSDLWARSTYLCLDHLPTTQVAWLADADPASQQALAQRVSFVPSELWEGWTAETRDEAELTACTSGDVEVLDSRRDVVAMWRMIEAGLAVLGRRHPAERTASVLLHHAVVPWAVSAGLDREAARLVESQAGPGDGQSLPRPCCPCLERAIRGAADR
ncbi:MAG: hypothetical protein IT306_19165 [Chloroflexi bacterium]|nr:hypothetical protein [Chloroflexota bacterium]